MLTTFVCSGCGLKMSAPDTMTGKSAECSKCRAVSRVPRVANLPPPLPPPPALPVSSTHGASQAQHHRKSNEDDDALIPSRFGELSVGWRVISGIAQGVQKSAVTHVSGSGGVFRGSGYGYVESFVEKSTEFYVVLADGSEIPYHIQSESLMIRDGHAVSAVHVKGDHEQLAAIVNHTTREAYYAATAEDLVRQLGLAAPRWQPTPLEIILFVVSGMMFILGLALAGHGAGAIAFLGMGIGGVCAFVQEMRHFEHVAGIANVIDDRLNRIVAQLQP